MGNLFAQASTYLRAHKEYRRWLALFLCLALVISVATTALLTRPGVAMTHTERVLDCPFEGEAAHTHTEDCYRDGTLVCPLPERELHIHTEDCYTTEKMLSCGEEESDGHVHTESCYSLVQGELLCTDESEEHVHTDDCYAWENVLSCGLEEGEGAHHHTDDCYTETKVLSCGQEELLTEHVHGPGCFVEIVVDDEEPETTEEPVVEETAEPEPTETPVVTETPAVTEEPVVEETAGPEPTETPVVTETPEVTAEPVVEETAEPEPTETPVVTETPEVTAEPVVEETAEPEPTETPVVTETPEVTAKPVVEETAEPEPTETPVVTEEPVIEETGDPEADLEYYWMWAESFSHVKLSGDWSEDLVTVARTQLGYTESARNYITDESGRRGYTRYGAWYGLPYDDWCAMFVSFCLNFADIPREAMPWDCITTRWVDTLTERDMFAVADSGYVPKAGDLVFFTETEYRERVPSHVGIVVEVSDGRIISIEGNNGPTVAEFSYELSDECLYGFGILPEEEKPDPAEAAAEALAVITAADGSALPEEAQPHAYPLTGSEAEAAESAVEAWLAVSETEQGNARAELIEINAVERAAVLNTAVTETRYEVFEIGLDNVEETAYEGGFLVRVTLPEALTGRDFALFHLSDSGVEALQAEYAATLNTNGTETVTGFSFVTESFSPFVLRYTVDFHYEGGDGTGADFSIPGGGFLTLPELVRGLHLVRDGEEQAFLSAVESVEFSDPGLIWVGQAEADMTVGALKAELGLNSAYSAELSAEEIAAFDATELTAGEWLLISLHPFDTPETLTITLKNGTVYSIDVTDARIVAYYLNDRGELYEVGVTYGEDAQIPDGATLKITEYAQDSAEYLKARGDVLADLEKNEVSVDPDSFGLAALDISILDAEGNEIEPAAPVQVDMSIKALPGVENVEAIADSLVVNHHVETENGVVLQTVFSGNTEGVFQFNMPVDADQPVEVNALPGDQAVTMSFETPSFSTFTVTWGTGSTDNGLHLMAGSIDDGQYILYGLDASDGKYYALVPSTNLRTVEITLDSNNQVVYSGSENLYWTVNKDNTQSTYEFSFTANSRTYYLSAGNGQVSTRTSHGNYNSGSNTTRFKVWDGQGYSNYNHIYSADNTFLQSYNGSFRFNTVSGTWYNSYQVYFERQGATPGVSGPHATIHYVDEDGNELTVSNGQPVNDTNGGLNYLIYDIDNYEYAYTYRNENTTANRITPILRYQNSMWRYTTGTNENGVNNNTWYNLSSGDEIYVVYKPKAAVPQGGTPIPKVTGEKPAPPEVTKTSTVNGDGTNTLTLSVSGHTSVMEAEKLADVIVVYDVSGSMKYRMDSETEATAGQRRMDYAQTATKNLANALLGKNTTTHPELIRMSLISFSNTAQVVQNFTTDKDTFNAAVNNLPSPDGGTNWEYALQLANEMAVESDRATFVIFVTDGNPTFRQTRGVLNNSGTGSLGDSDVTNYYFAYNVYGVGSSDVHGRNYAAALTQAKSIVNHNKNFYTIGISNDVTNLTNLTTQAGAGADHSKTATSNDELVAAFDDIAASIIALMGQSSVQINDGITSMTQTVEKTGLTTLPSEDDFVYTKERLATAAEIANPSTIPTGAVLEDREGTKYVVWHNWDPTTERANKASFVKADDYDTSKKGAVVWNMGDNFMLEDGVTYKVSFKVWPSQEAYDLLARLNNGTIGWDDLTADQQAQIEKSGETYILRTNEPNAGYSYVEATKSGDTVTPTSEEPITGTFQPVDPLKLVSIPLEVRKDWRTSLVSVNPKPSQIEMDLLSMDYGTATSTYKTVTLSEANNWYSNGNYVSYGLVKRDSSSLVVYEQGHDFTLEEKYDQNSQSDLLASHYWSFDPGIYRPMVVGEGATTKQTVLERITNDSGIPAAFSGSTSSMFWHDSGAADSSNPLYAANMRPTYNGYTGDYYWLPDANGDYHAYIDTGSNVILLAINKQRSYVDLIKKVDSDETCDEYFTFTGKICVNMDGMTPAEIQVNREDVIWASIYDENGQRVDLRTLDEEGDDRTSHFWRPSSIDPNYARYDKNYRFVLDASKDAENGTDNTFTLEIKDGWSVRFLNLPTGSTVEFNETDIPDGYEFNSADLTVKRLEELTNHVVTETLSYSEDSTIVTGTVAEADAGYTVTYHNGTQKTKTQIKVEKQWGDSLEHGSDTIGFTVYQKAVTASGTVVRELEYRTGTITGSGSVTVDDLPKTGWLGGQSVTFQYYVVETSGKEGYTPVILHTEAVGETPETFTIRNVPDDEEIDKDTDVTFTKVWKGPNGADPTINHDGDSIQVKLIQKAVDSGYVPVTVKLYNAGDSNPTSNVTYYVSKGSNVRLTATPYENRSGHTVTVNGNTSSGSASEFTYSFENVTSALTIEAKLNYTYNSYNDQWGSSTERHRISNGVYWYTWTHSFAATSGTLLTSIDEVIEAVKNNAEVVPPQQYIYTLGKNTLTGAPYSGTAADWVGTVPDLPLFKKIDDSTFYAYYYSVEELSVNGEMIRPKPTTGAAADVIGQTDEYLVSQTGTTITNTEKPKTSVSVAKQWKNARGETMITAPAGAEVIFELYRDGEATGLRIVLNGLKDVAGPTVGAGEELNPYVIEANTYESASWVATWNNLIQNREDGTPYNYTVKEISGFAGYDTVYDPSTATAAETGGTITNRQQLKSFSFSKAWIPLNSSIETVALDALQEWGADRTISVTLYRKAQGETVAEAVCSYVLGGTGEFTPTATSLSDEEAALYKLTLKATSDGKLVTFTIDHGLLPESTDGKSYTYYVVETGAAPGIYNSYSGVRDGNTVVWNHITWSDNPPIAYDGEVFLNHQISGYELPATGGVGTLSYRLGGVALIGAALAGLLLRKARRRAKGGDPTA